VASRIIARAGNRTPVASGQCLGQRCGQPDDPSRCDRVVDSPPGTTRPAQTTEVVGPSDFHHGLTQVGKGGHVLADIALEGEDPDGHRTADRPGPEVARLPATVGQAHADRVDLQAPPMASPRPVETLATRSASA